MQHPKLCPSNKGCDVATEDDETPKTTQLSKVAKSCDRSFVAQNAGKVILESKRKSSLNQVPKPIQVRTEGKNSFRFYNVNEKALKFKKRGKVKSNLAEILNRRKPSFSSSITSKSDDDATHDIVDSKYFSSECLKYQQDN